MEEGEKVEVMVDDVSITTYKRQKYLSALNLMFVTGSVILRR